MAIIWRVFGNVTAFTLIIKKDIIHVLKYQPCKKASYKITVVLMVYFLSLLAVKHGKRLLSEAGFMFFKVDIII